MANLIYYGLNLQLEYSLDTIAQRDAIPVDAGYREIGTRCYVQATNTIYQLAGGIANANWIVVSTGGMIDSANVAYTPTTLTDWSPVPTQVSLALDQLAAKKGKYLLMLGSLNPSGVWYPLEFVGPTSGSSSSPSPTGYGTGVGFCRVPRTGKLSTFKFTNATPPASDCTNIQVYIAPNGNLSLLGYSGITLSILAGEYISSAVSIIDPTAFDVNEDDIIVLYNADPFFGYTPDALTITAELNFS